MSELVFVYGTLKRGLPNAHLMPGEFVATATTISPVPLVVGPHGVPFILPVAGEGHVAGAKVVQGEIFDVQPGDLAYLDAVRVNTRVTTFQL
jgi:gamma-glutamylcyclotransferase (GGCT)/AIG2-like uncharacterized protein YtfP